MVIAFLINSQTTEEFLGNFAEAGFEPKHVSVIMKSAEDRSKITDDLGPLKKVDITNLADRLKIYGLNQDEISRYLDEFDKGKALVAIDFYPNQSVVVMLNDYHPELLRII